jgi:putative transposase
LRKHGISAATYYAWKSKYGGLNASDVKRQKELEAEHSKLKRMYADLAMENRALKDLSTENCNAVREERRGGVRASRVVSALGAGRASILGSVDDRRS